jgi:Uma2 family endonuclease
LKRATYEDVLNAPEHKVAEILDGELFLSPRPASRHSVASSRLGVILGTFDGSQDGRGGWWILDEPELHFGEDVVVPDLAGWRRERMAAVPDVAFFSLAPDWVEVLRLRDGAWTIVAVCSGPHPVRVEPFDAIELPLGRLWVEPA